MDDAKPKRGRPLHGLCKLTPRIHADVVKWIAAGNYIETAAHLAGVNKVSVYAWLKRGHREKKGPFRDFLNAVKKAEAESEARLLIIIEKAASKNWQAAAWRLERKHPKRWGRRDAHTVRATATVDLAAQVSTSVRVDDLTNEQLAAIAAQGLPGIDDK